MREQVNEWIGDGNDLLIVIYCFDAILRFDNWMHYEKLSASQVGLNNLDGSN
jgi:hypothetical protein